MASVKQKKRDNLEDSNIVRFEEKRQKGVQEEISGYNENWAPRIIEENGLRRENEKRKNMRETVIL
jgi:hypothetical protein